MTPPPPRVQSGGRWSDLARRMGAGLILAIAGMALILLSGVWLRAGLVLLYVGLMWELVRLVARPGLKGRQSTGVALLGGAAVAALLFAPGPWTALALLVPLVAGWRVVAPTRRAVFVLFAAVMALAAFGMVWLRDQAGLGAALWVVAVVIQADVLGYFVGRAVGGPKFWPTISPKKTWSGTAAGWAGALVLGLGLVAAGAASWGVVAFGPALALAGQMGDIAESWLKRRMEVKDSSGLIPGHGGLMDRFDAMVAALAVALMIGLTSGLPRIGG